jgi:membrane protein
VGRLKRSGSGGAGLLLARIDLLLSRLFTVRTVRVINLYLERRGPLLAAGLAYRLFFAISALLVVGFATAGLVIAGNEALQDLIIESVSAAVPGLIETDETDGLFTPEVLFDRTSGLGLTLLLSAGVMLFTSLSWVSGMRQAMRGIFALAPAVAHPFVLRLRDLVTLALLAVVMVLTTVLGVIANNTLGALFTLLDLRGISQVLTQLAGFGVMIVLDTMVMLVLLKSASAIDIPRSVRLQGALIAGLGSTLLRTFSAQLLAALSGNPLLFPFAVILALFVWFFILSQVYLLATAWCAVGSADKEHAVERREHGRAGSLRRQSQRRVHSQA